MKKSTEGLDQRISYLTVKELALKWGVSERRITQLCTSGKLKGAVQCGDLKKYWMIPSFVKKPGDNRVKTGKYSRRESGIVEQYCNELTETDPISKLKELPAGSVDMIITDLSFMQGNHKDLDSLPIMWQEYRRILKDTGVAAVLTRGIRGIRVVRGNEGWLRYKFAWVFDSFAHPSRTGKPQSSHMDVWIFAKDDEAACMKTMCTDFEGLVSYGKKNPGSMPDVISFRNADGSPIEYFDDEKEMLGRFLIRTYTEPGDIVVDNACYHLEFIKAALKEGRNFIGTEARTYPVYDKMYEIGPDGSVSEPEPSGHIWLIDDESLLSLYQVWKGLPEDKRAYIMSGGQIREFEYYGDTMIDILTATGYYPHEIYWDEGPEGQDEEDTDGETEPPASDIFY